jgi:hypothetical protein
MHDHADHHDAELLLRLYELRREERLRRAREWVLQKFQAEPAEELLQRYPFGSEENISFRMVMSYWDMAASLVKYGLIHEDLFFENNREFWVVWRKAKPAAIFIRERYKDPQAMKNLEDLADKYEKWMEKRAPGALAAVFERLQAVGANKP